MQWICYWSLSNTDIIQNPIHNLVEIFLIFKHFFGTKQCFVCARFYFVPMEWYFICIWQALEILSAPTKNPQIEQSSPLRIIGYHPFSYRYVHRKTNLRAQISNLCAVNTLSYPNKLQIFPNGHERSCITEKFMKNIGKLHQR